MHVDPQPHLTQHPSFPFILKTNTKSATLSEADFSPHFTKNPSSQIAELQLQQKALFRLLYGFPSLIRSRNQGVSSHMVVKERGFEEGSPLCMMGKQVASLSLLLLLLLLLVTVILPLKTVDGQGRFNRFRSGSFPPPPYSEETTIQGFFQRGGYKNVNGGDDLFDVEKRRVHTGPNPLHNR